MKPRRVSVPASDAITALSFLREKCHESLSSMCALTGIAGGSRIHFVDGATVRTEVETIFTKNVLTGPFVIFIGMSFPQSNFLAIKAGCDSNINTIC